MRTSAYQANRLSRCYIPLVELCDADTQIKLDLGSCGPCSATGTSLLLSKDGCPEYETICTEKPCENHSFGCCTACCTPTIQCETVEIAKPAVKYPLLEINSQGLSVFALDSKLRSLGYGRYKATVFIDDRPTNVVFGVEYVPYTMSLTSITTSKAIADTGGC